MDTYVVRVYPNAEGEPERLRGVVSRVASGESVIFRSVEELAAFLADPQGGQGIGEDATP